ncbi:AAA family ATPase [Teredinibacter haidensis]|uniref:AAA family ATPase n=1 Tax=Teredinibacter haidensis TaxID=2731755 RepID=UPI000948F825|nr:AAA family ATPase [Teredinibacter haidensis]
MRILQVRFKNLNSLLGEWEIDLSHPAFASDGIFAITGPTGAGKTTLLDAICLALYGRTPRLAKVTKSTNEIMSRQTGECFAEVTFETQAGHFRCHWSQHRARRKPEGDLQSPKHEIANADSGEIFEAKIKGVADRIEAATGMDFDRFTRSMLLAQGGFSAFLQATSDDRAPILEQITGTEIYSQISIHVHERRALERKNLETLQAELAGIQLLTPEEEHQLSESLDQKAQQDTQLGNSINQKNTAITWLKSMVQLESEIKQLDLAKDELQIRLHAFAPEKERLRLANMALELAADYAALTAVRKEQDVDRSSLRTCQNALPTCADIAKQAEETMATTTEHLEARKAEQQQALPVIRKVRELDLKIAEKSSPMKTANDSIAELSKSLNALKTQQTIDTNELINKQGATEELKSLLEASKEDSVLVEQLAALHSRFETLKANRDQLSRKSQEAEQAETRCQTNIKACENRNAQLGKAQTDLDTIKKQGEEKKNELLDTLERKDSAHWREQQTSLIAQNDLIAKAQDAIQAHANAEQRNETLEQRKDSLQSMQDQIKATLISQTHKQATLETELKHLETQLVLLKKIDDLEAARHQLNDGDPCPLCGAESHPYAEGNVPKPDDTQQQLSAVRAELKTLQHQLTEFNVTLAQQEKDLEQIAASQQECLREIDNASQIIHRNCAELPFAPEAFPADLNRKEALKLLLEKNKAQLSLTTHTIQAAELIEKELHALRESFTNARDVVANSEREAQAATHTKDSAVQELERLRKETGNSLQQQEELHEELQQKIQRFGMEVLLIEHIDATMAQLTLRRDQWQERSKERALFEKVISALEIQIHHRENALIQTEESLNSYRKNLAELQRERESFSLERLQIFGNKDTNQEETRLSSCIEASENEVDSARRALSTASQNLSQLTTKISEWGKAIDAREIVLTHTETCFRGRLNTAGFSDEERYQSAYLEEHERKHLTLQSQALSDEKAEIGSREREKRSLLATESGKNITDESLDDLKKALADSMENLRELQQEIGGIQRKLTDNDSLKQEQRVRFKAINLQKRECERWDLLHELIGSSDGKKYRNFAQGMTFEIMISHANRQLQKMTDRYLLVRDENQPLELNVIDNYQAGEIRSTKNLSGGESFIVSLSLALGLSNMASKNVRVDSLFLDEGFGTLDEEALDTALETLSSLQQEGKLIGVISHVSALKERIGTQIQVAPSSGGRSHIIGPGCRLIKGG